MHTASAGHRESPVTLMNSKRRSTPLIRATSPGASAKRSFNGTVGPDGLFSSQAVTQRRQIRATHARMAGSLAKSVPRSELVNERQGRAAIAEPFAHVEPEHTVEAGQRETQPTADIDIVLTIRLGPPFDVGGIGKHGGTDLG